MKKTIDNAAGTVTFTFDGEAPVVFNVASASETVRNHAMLHGFAARLGDNAAITKSADNGFTVTEAMRREAVLELAEHYATGTGDWNLRAAAAPKRPAMNATILAIATKLGISYEAAQARVAEQFLESMMKGD